MAKNRPPFLNSPNFVMDVDNWHLTENATDEEKKQFAEWMAQKDIIFPHEERP